MKVEVFKKEKVVNTDATVVEYDNVIEETKDQVVTATRVRRQVIDLPGIAKFVIDDYKINQALVKIIQRYKNLHGERYISKGENNE